MKEENIKRPEREVDTFYTSSLRKNVFFALTFALALSSCASLEFGYRLHAKPGDSLEKVEEENKKLLRTLTIGETRIDRYYTGFVISKNRVVTETWSLESQPLEYIVKMNALAETAPVGKVAIFSGIEGVNVNDLQFKEAVLYLKKVFTHLGVEITTNPAEADSFISMYYSISDPDVNIQQISVPIYGYDPGTTSTTTINGTANLTATTTTSGKGLYVQGYSNQTIRSVNYNRVLILKSIDAEKYRTAKEEVENWEVRASSYGRSSDLRLILPVLFAASWPYIGKYTSGQEAIRFDDNKLEVQILRYLPLE